jgi:glycosyltransferase involved in cell wall biosynthesis
MCELDKLKNSDITVDILLSTYNGEKYLLQQLESLKLQLHDNWRWQAQ